MISQAHNAGDAVLGNVQAHVPIITLALSSFREVKLLYKHNTDIVSSAKNIGLDIAGTGGGALVGAKVGAGIGTLFGPGIGTAIGAGVGAVIGAFGGRYASNKIKTQPFKDASEDYNNIFNEYKVKLDNASAIVKTKYDAALVDNQNILQNEVNREINRLENAKALAVLEQKNRYEMNDQQIQRLFQTALLRLQEKVSSLNKELSKIPLLSKLYPSSQYIRLVSQKRYLLKLTSETNTAAQMIICSNSSITQEEKTTLSLEFLSAINVLEDEIVSHLKMSAILSETNKSKILKEYEKAKANLIDMRKKVFKTLSIQLAELKEWAQAELKGPISELKVSQKQLLAEMKKLGFDKS